MNDMLIYLQSNWKVKMTDIDAEGNSYSYAENLMLVNVFSDLKNT